MFEWPDGSTYDGLWADNQIKGLGTYRWKDGRQYNGEWEDNNMEGMGIYTWPDGRVYEGEYLNDKKHGYGIYTWADKRRYQGNWHMGKQHGVGVYRDQQGEEKCGLWEDGKRIEWFEEKGKLEDVRTGRTDYRHLFKKETNATQAPINPQFYEPPGFEVRIKDIRDKLPLPPFKPQLS